MKLFFFFCALFYIPIELISNPNGFCSVPVADLLGTSMYQAQKNHLPIQSYDAIPFSDKAGDFVSPRHSQLLFNEQVKIIETFKDEVKVRIFHWYHQHGNKKQTTFWTQKSAITPFSALSENDINKIPAPIDFKTGIIPHQNIATLIEPFKNYSAGTRFVKTPKQPHKKYVSVFAFNPKTQDFKKLLLPKKRVVTTLPTSSIEKRELFVEILQQWADQTDGYIPYVFGGASIGKTKNNSFTWTKLKHGKRTATLYHRDYLKPVYYGIDCAHTIARAAQIAGIPYFVTNTKSIKNSLPPLTKHDELESGDIIVWKGHTAIVRNIKNGLIIEARGYDHGYGILQEIPLHEQFEGISTFAHLKDAVFAKKQIGRLNKAGKKIQTLHDIQFFKLPV